MTWGTGPLRTGLRPTPVVFGGAWVMGYVVGRRTEEVHALSGDFEDLTRRLEEPAAG